MAQEFYASKYYTAEEIDQRLLQGTYDDAVEAGFRGSKEEFIANMATMVSSSQSTGSEEIDDAYTKVISEAIRKVPQTLTEAEKAQTRTNIGALGSDEFKTINGESIVGTGNIILKYTVSTSELNHYITINNLTENSEYVYTIDGIQKYMSDVTWEDYTKSSILRIKGLNYETPNRLLFDMANIKIIKGFKQVVFENLLIEVSSQWGEGKEHILEFVDTDVRFVDCIFYIDGAKTTSLFNIDNSIITWINSYEYSYSTYRRNLQNVNAHLDYATLLSGYDTAGRVLLPVGAQVTLSDGRKGIFVGEDAIQVYDSGIKIVDASGILKS